MRIINAIAALMVLAGCATASPVALPNGVMGHSIECSALADCYNKAGEVCGGGYSIIATDGREVPVMTGGAFYTVSNRTLIVQCK